MIEVGYALSSEEHSPARLVELARQAEDAGFPFALISDHMHPWTDTQGEAPYVWSVLGAIAASTARMTVGTGVTCPLIRQHPVVVAQAAATVAGLMPGRFFLGVGTGENLNEHVTGARWPTPGERLEMLEEAIDILRRLWEGDVVSHRGKHFTVDQARIYSIPDAPPLILVAAKKPHATELASDCGDGLISTAPDPSLVERFRSGERTDMPRPCIGQLTVCVADTEAAGRSTALEYWPNGALGGDLGQELKMPSQFMAASEHVTTESVGKVVVCGSDVDTHLRAIAEFAEAGFTGVCVHQVGPDQDAFFRFYRDSVMPALTTRDAGAGESGDSIAA
jgi:coenzyme F420-dependent glucose-6-phosphate dehydrogenase